MTDVIVSRDTAVRDEGKSNMSWTAWRKGTVGQWWPTVGSRLNFFQRQMV